MGGEKMKRNIDSTDRALRIIAGILLIGLGLTNSYWLCAIGAVLVATAAIGWCPPYALLGISTCKNS